MQELASWLESVTGLDPLAQRRVALSLAVVAVLWLVRRLLLRLVTGYTEDVRVRYRWKKNTAYAGFLIAAFALVWIWFRGFTWVATYLGLLSAGVAIALREPLVDLAGWLFILWRRPFEVGDRIQIGAHAGDVIDVRLFQFTLMEIGNWVAADQSTGRVIHIPNGSVFSEALANYTKGFEYIWNELPVLVTFESDWRAAKEILTRVAERHAADLTDEAARKLQQASKRFMIFYRTLTPTVYTSVEDSGVLLTIRYLCEPRGRRGSAQAIWEDVLREFAGRDDIDFAYPTRRYYDNRTEGKGGRSAEGSH